MKQITKNFRLGFGSFIDKKVMPFVTLDLKKQASPCSEGCAPTYGFKHQMSLTTTPINLLKKLLHAIAQSLERSIQKNDCFSTDAGFHYAGDGRLAGITTPNDGQCHLDTDGYYDKSTEQDYPSIALLHQKIKEKK
uniref:Integrin beta n=1 Tax=Ditylenchus dipsaci TaxID=166011 RepID=A0A915ESX8_9BILA